MNHIPGPWKAEHKHRLSDIYAGSRYICTVGHSSVQHIAEMDKANAQLISVVPDYDVVARQIVSAINSFEQECSDKEHTDTDIVWELLQDFRSVLNELICKSKGEKDG